MLYSETREIEEFLAAAIREAGGTLSTAETLCRATQNRQNAALDLCGKGCDLVLVVGGLHSSNTTQLYRLASEHCPAYLVPNADAVELHTISHYNPSAGTMTETCGWLADDVRDIGLLAGASCPPSDISAMVRKLRDLAANSCSG
jgi:4-hydroxy-3-methylbut-2-enyl diphosphate reductase